MPLFAKIKDAYDSINHLGTGSDKDPLTKMGYYPNTGRHESRTVRQAHPNVPGFNHPQVNCSTGIIERLKEKNLMGITGCQPGYSRDYRFYSDAYTTFLGSRSGSPDNPAGVTVLAIPGVATNSDVNLTTVLLDQNLTYPILTINETIVIKRPHYSHYGTLQNFDIILSYKNYEDASAAQERGYVDGVCHPNQVEAKLNEFAAIERKRCYEDTEEVSSMAEWQFPESTATLPSSPKSSLSPNDIALASVTGIGLALATPPAIIVASFVAVAGITGIVIGAGALITRNRFKQNNQTEKKDQLECPKPAK